MKAVAAVTAAGLADGVILKSGRPARFVERAGVDDTILEITSAIASGDTEAFTRFFHSRFDQMYAEARRATGRDEAFCMDVVQDAMVRVIKSVRPMDAEKRLRGWLRVVVQSCAYDRLRKEIRRQRWEETASEMPSERATGDDLGERLDWLEGELSNLDDRQAKMVVMRYRLGWTLQRIGAALGLSPGAVDGRLGRAVTTLRRRARETFDE
ncbi:MAG: sigma-70 family RNA polymerase sigma factor [bacterium]|nr:sigma-70 family RNA polymerase sigma factor [bacterium]